MCPSEKEHNLYAHTWLSDMARVYLVGGFGGELLPAFPVLVVKIDDAVDEAHRKAPVIRGVTHRCDLGTERGGTMENRELCILDS